jgi:hypothetical protein
MPGLQATYAVGAIVSAAMSACSLLNKAAASRQTQKLAIPANEKLMEKQLLTQLQESPRLIYNEFQRGLTYGGTFFANGDGI